MASTKVRGITIELGADTSGISKALKGVNSEIGSTQKQLKDVDRLLKLDPTNTELLEQKQRLLGDRVQETSKKLDTLKQAQEEVGKTLKETGEGQEQYEALTREIVSCEQELKKAEEAASSFNVTAAKISATADKVASGLSNAAEKTRGLSTAAAGALVGIAGLGYKAAQDADDLNTLAKQTGFTTAELQKMQYAADRIDVPMETITKAAAKMTKQLSSSEDKFTDLGVATRNADGSFRDVSDIFNDTVQVLSKIPNETERDTAAMEIFGKNANELAGIIDDGGASLRALGEEAENLGVIIPQDQLDAANELNDAIDKLKSEGMGAFAKLGSEIAEMVLPYIPQIVESLEKVLNYVKEINPSVLKLVVGITAAMAVMSPLLSTLSGVASGISVLSKVIGGIATAFSGASAASGGFAAAIGAISAPVVAAVAAIGVLVAAFVHLWNTNEEFRNNIIATWNSIKQKFDEFGQGIVDRLNALGFDFKSFSDVVRAVWDGLCKFLGPVFEQAFKAVEAILGGALKVLTGMFDFWVGLFTGDWEMMWRGVKETFSGIWEAITGIFKSKINIITHGINTVIKGINSASQGSVNIPLIPQLAKGGIVSSGTAMVGEAGPELLTVANGRAMVQPLTNNTTNHYAGATNNFYIQSSDPEQVAEEVSTILNNQMQRLQGAWA